MSEAKCSVVTSLSIEEDRSTGEGVGKSSRVRTGSVVSVDDVSVVVSSMVDSTVTADGSSELLPRLNRVPAVRVEGLRSTESGALEVTAVGRMTGLNSSGDCVSNCNSSPIRVVNVDVINVRAIPLRLPSTGRVEVVEKVLKTTVDGRADVRLLDVENRWLRRDLNGADDEGSLEWDVAELAELATKLERE